jgi:hypothetical protein
MSEELKDIVVDVTPEKKGEIATNEKGQIIAKDMDGLWRIAKAAIDSGMVPKGYTKPSQVIMGLQFAAGIGLAPTVASLTNIAVINGQPSIFGELPLKLARESGQLEYFNEYLIDSDYNKISVDNKNLTTEIFAAVCEIQRKGYELKKFYWTAAQQAKANAGVKAIWNSYYEIMMKRKARSLALKDEFGDVLGAMKIAEYDHNFAPDIKDVTPRNQEAAKINDMFGDESGS